ncbi:hypothetical protein DL89DRAFT_300838 [Linderina pennispora]|uniref:FAD-binding FR-type domain-containing protein n=1 Tax=Linderina pennispora TaxID=61395 RepID=A0A1Y1WN13_9FUNG|nr:uncharacterized protein DL89DRAFT_300838 [Linderina pennispora]ORX74596.1 hypothetical protein DL89DRAFT_300838 [Linderina pennispora]
MYSSSPLQGSAQESLQTIATPSNGTSQHPPSSSQGKPARLAPLDIPIPPKLVANKDGSLPAEAGSGSDSDVDTDCAPRRGFQWSNLANPEFYPEITLRRAAFFFIWTIPHIIITAYNGSITSNKLIDRVRLSSKNCILFDMASILVFMSPTFMLLLQRTFLPRFVKLEKNIHAHKVASYTLLFWSALHVGIYYDRYIDASHPKIKDGKLVPGTPLVKNLFKLFIGDVEIVRRRQFELFYYVHHLFVVIIVFTFLHRDNQLAYKYLGGPLALYVLDRLYRSLRSIVGKSPIRAVVQHPSGVVEIQMDKKIVGVRPGQYVKVYCPSVSMLQWHPLTISSAPEEELLTVHFRLEGTWTRNLAKRLGCDFDKDARGSSVQNVMPLLYIDGPYTAPTEHFFNYEVGVLIAAGIGVTPAASVLRSVYFQWIRDRYAMNTKKVYLFWVYRDIGTLEWFKDLLVALDEEGLSSIVQVRTYFTGKIPDSRIPQLAPPDDKFGDQVINTSIGTKSYVGRPDFNSILESLGELHPGQRIGTFFCGPKPMARKVRREAHKWDGILRKKSNTKIDFCSETFS